MKQIWKKFQLFINKNIGRKLTFLMVPLMCIVMAVTIILVNHVYMERYMKNIEEDTLYVTDTFKLNLDFCMEDVKSFLNTLSMSEAVKSMVTMDMEEIDYQKLLACERQIRQQTGALTFLKGYVQDVIVVGNNGYQYNYLHSIKGNITDTAWFQQYVDRDKKGFQYILPHKVDFYVNGMAASDEVLSVVLPIRSEQVQLGYVICDIYMEKAASLPVNMGETDNVRAYLVSSGTSDYYDFREKDIFHDKDGNITKYLGGKDNEFQAADQDFIIYSRMEASDWYIVVVYLYKDIIAPAAAAQNIGFMMLAAGCITIGILGWFIAGKFRRPIDELLQRIHQVEQHDFQSVEVPAADIQPGEILQIRNHFEAMTRQIDELVHKVYLQEIYQKTIEYENLVNQVNPHFIYNVLQLIQARAVMNDDDEIDDIVVALSRLMRYTMENKDKIVTVKEECGYIESYLDLYQRRYRHKFSYEIVLEKDVEMLPVLKFIMQPVVENCIKHGFKGLKREGHVKIHIYRDGDKIRFLTEDNGKGIAPDRLEELRKYMENADDQSLHSIGLKNTCRRLQLVYGEEAGITLESVADECTKICCYIPADFKATQV